MWINIYDWATSELPFEDRPKEEVLAEDEKFDGWHEAYIRNLKNKAFLSKSKNG